MADNNDNKNTGAIDIESLESLADSIGEDVSEDEINALFKAFQDMDTSIAPASLSDIEESDIFAGDMDDVNEEDLDAMLKSLMEDSSDDEPWTPSEDFGTEEDEEPLRVSRFEMEDDDAEIDLDVLYTSPAERDNVKLGFRTWPRWVRRQFKVGDGFTKVLLASIIFMSVVVILAAGAFAGFMLFTDNGAADDAHFTIASSNDTFNNASHTFVHLTAIMYEGQFTLERLLLDSVATVFFISGVEEPGRYLFSLTDANDRAYARDIVHATDVVRNTLMEQIEIRFEPMDATAGAFTLSVTDLRTGQVVDFEMSFDDDAITIGRVITQPIIAETELDGIGVSIDSGTFSAFNTSLNFSPVSGSPDAELVFSNSVVSPVSLRHGGFMIPAVNNNANISSHGGVTLASIDFAPLRSLTGRIDVTFAQMYMRYNLNTRIPAASMLATGDDRAIQFDMGSHVFNLRGMVHQGDFFVVPMHGLHRTATAEVGHANYDYERKPTTVDAVLIGIEQNGREIRIEGSVMYDARGTDLRFDTRDNEAILSIPTDRLYLQINSISILMPNLATTIDLDTIGFTPCDETAAAAAYIEAHFAATAYRLIAEFAPQNQAHTEHRAQVRHINFSDNAIHAQVTRRLAFVQDGALQEILLNYRVTAERMHGGGIRIIDFVRE